jgi:sulfite exporter TauE/SafE
MNNPLTIGAALLLGLAASGHCLVMCGGISTALGFATAKDANGKIRPALLVCYQLGRIVSYSLAGLLVAGVLGGAIALLDIEAVRRALRVVAALALVLAALVAFGRVRDPGSRVGHRLWNKIAPLGRRLLPVASIPRAIAFGMVWGWMPCGFVYSVLMIAMLQMDALRGAMVMAAFGFGTAPALLITAFGVQRFSRLVSLPATRHVAGSVLLLSAVLTFIGPWVAHSMSEAHGLLASFHGGHGH